MAYVKIKRTKYMRNINDNAVQGRLSENYLTQRIIAWNTLRHEIFAIYGTSDPTLEAWAGLFPKRWATKGGHKTAIFECDKCALAPSILKVGGAHDL